MNNDDEKEDIIQQLNQWQEILKYKYLEENEKKKEESTEGQLERNEELYVHIFDNSDIFKIELNLKKINITNSSFLYRHEKTQRRIEQLFQSTDTLKSQAENHFEETTSVKEHLQQVSITRTLNFISDSKKNPICSILVNTDTVVK